MLMLVISTMWKHLVLLYLLVAVSASHDLGDELAWIVFMYLSMGTACVCFFCWRLAVEESASRHLSVMGWHAALARRGLA